jgi:hypothetical protein
VLLLGAPCGARAGVQASSYQRQVGDGLPDAVVTVLLVADGQAQPVGSGLVVRGDGLILTAYHLVKGAGAIQIRLRNGETFDRAELVGSDERRNVALLRVAAAGLTTLPGVSLEESQVGAPVAVVSTQTSGAENIPAGVLTSVSLADEIKGAGRGYRVLKFNAPIAPDAAGGVLVDEKGRALGLLAALPQAETQSYAVPLSSLIGLSRSISVPLASASPRATNTNAPYPIPQSQVSVPQRPVSPLEARGPGSVVVKPTRAVDVLLASKTIYVTSRTNFFKPEQLINELKKQPELDAWGLTFVDDMQVADLVLTLDHVLFTYKFTFTLAHQRTGVVVATGSVIIWDGNLGAPHMAERVLAKLMQVRAQPATKPEPTDDRKAKQ